jgi:hypothetical protein
MCKNTSLSSRIFIDISCCVDGPGTSNGLYKIADCCLSLSVIKICQSFEKIRELLFRNEGKFRLWSCSFSCDRQSTQTTIRLQQFQEKAKIPKSLLKTCRNCLCSKCSGECQKRTSCKDNFFIWARKTTYTVKIRHKPVKKLLKH